MKFVEEIVVEEFLPTFRSMLAGALRERDLTQSDVAQLLGISQSAVSKYAHGEVRTNPEIVDDERVQQLVERLADGLVHEEMSRVQALVETEILIRELERGDLLARIHERAYPPLSAYGGTFDVHDPDSEVRTTERILASVRRGLRSLENTNGFPRLVPAVGSNLVEARPDAESVDDVAAVPGRILDVMGRTTVPADPAFGVSEHVASVLLAAREAGSDARAALNIRYDSDIVDTLESAGYVTAAFDAETDLDAAIETAFDETPEASILYQTGGFGVEPIIYVLAEDAPAAVEVVRTVI